MRCLFTICVIIVMNGIITEQGIIFDTKPKQYVGCSPCQKIAKERCHDLQLCQQVAHGACPAKNLKERYRNKPIFSDEDSAEVFGMLTAKKYDKEEDRGVFDLLNGILTAVHTNTKATLKRARKKKLTGS